MNVNLVAKDAIHLYRMIWQFERWLRLMVYVELRARDNRWEDVIKKHANDWPPRSIEGDKKHIHMMTAHRSAISYLTLGELWNIVCDEKNWKLFKQYFPPKDNTDARIKEVKNIRNRIMHFREPHEHDVSRMTLFLKDFEVGVRLFCKTYHRHLVGNDDNDLIKILKSHWNRIGYNVEMDYLECGFLNAHALHVRRPEVYASLNLIRRPWTENGEGLMYKFSVTSIRSMPPRINELDFEGLDYVLDCEKMLFQTDEIHDLCIHFFIQPSRNFSAIFPAHQGPQIGLEVISSILEAARTCGLRPRLHDHEIERLSRITPEYVLWPDHPFFITMTQ